MQLVVLTGASTDLGARPVVDLDAIRVAGHKVLVTGARRVLVKG